MKSGIILIVNILLLSLLCISTEVYAQKGKGVEVEGSILVTDLDPAVTFNIALKYNYWFNPWMGYSIGIQGSNSDIKQSFDSPSASDAKYYLEEDIYEFNGILGFKLASPTFKRVGIMTDFNFVFEPIPFNLVGIEKKIFEPDYVFPAEKIKSRFVFTRFNPSYALQVSLFYDIKDNIGGAKLAIGYGISNHNPYNAYYHAKIDNIWLRDHAKLRPEKVGHVLFIRLSGY